MSQNDCFGTLGKGETMLSGNFSVSDNKFFKIYIAFLSEPEVLIKRKQPGFVRNFAPGYLDMIIY